jgi:hypothetical protein
MQDQIEADEDADLQFARRLYKGCLVRLGVHHELTRIVAQYVSELEDLDSPMPLRRSTVGAQETTFVPLPE